MNGIGAREEFRDPLPHHLSKTPYRLSRAVDRILARKPVDGIEGEISQEICRRRGRSPIQSGGFAMPLDVAFRSGVLNTTTGTGGITNILSPTVADILRANCVVGRLGAQFLTDLTGGGYAIPQRSATVACGWVAESAAVAAGTPQVDGLVFTPHTVGARCDISWKFHRECPTADSLLISDILAAVGVEVDRVSLTGGGTGEPAGITATSSIPTQSFGTNGGAPTLALLCSMEKTLGTSNAQPNGFVTTPECRSTLRQVEKSSGSGRMLWNDRDKVLSYPAYATKNLPANGTKGSGTALSTIVLGDFTALTVGYWGAMDIIINPYLFSTVGVIRVSAFLDCDVHLRQNTAFVVAVDAITA